MLRTDFFSFTRSQKTKITLKPISSKKYDRLTEPQDILRRKTMSCFAIIDPDKCVVSSMGHILVKECTYENLFLEEL